jgi:hypothetical protein
MLVRSLIYKSGGYELKIIIKPDSDDEDPNKLITCYVTD